MIIFMVIASIEWFQKCIVCTREKSTRLSIWLFAILPFNWTPYHFIPYLFFVALVVVCLYWCQTIWEPCRMYVYCIRMRIQNKHTPTMMIKWTINITVYQNIFYRVEIGNLDNYYEGAWIVFTICYYCFYYTF